MTAHHLVNNEMPPTGRVFVGNVFKENRALFSCRPGPQGLHDRKDIVIYRLGQSHHGQLVAVIVQISGQISGSGIGVVTANGMKDVDAILLKLLRRHLERFLAGLHQTALLTVLHVGKFHPAVPNRTAPKPVKNLMFILHLRRKRHAPPMKESLVAVEITV